jgi:hypothetical protein
MKRSKVAPTGFHLCHLATTFAPHAGNRLHREQVYRISAHSHAIRPSALIQINYFEQACKLAHENGMPALPETMLSWRASSSSRPLVAFFWTLAGIPLLWGIWQPLKSAAVLFT